MKKTLALALVAAMTISMASMTAFAKTTYNNQAAIAEPEGLVATVTLSAKDLAEMDYTQGVKFIVVDAAAVNAIALSGPAPSGGAYAANDRLADADVALLTGDKLVDLIKAEKIKAEVDDSSVKVKFGDLGVMKLEDSATRVIYGWKQVEAAKATEADSKGAAYWGKDDTEPTEGKIGIADSEEVTLDKDGDNYVAYFNSLGKTLEDIDLVDEHVEAMQKGKEDAKKAADKAKDIADKLQKLDEKYGANIKGDDDFNGSNKQTGEDAKIKVNTIRKYKNGDTMDDYFTHAAKVAGAPSAWTDDGTNTWVYEAAIPAGLKVSDGHTVRLEFDLELGDKADLSKFTWKVYHIEGWCKATKVKNVEIVGNKLYAWVDSCSPFVVTRGDGTASTGADASNPSTGDFSAVPVALLAAAALGATGFVAYKKRKAE